MSPIVDLGLGRTRLVIRDSVTWARLWGNPADPRRQPVDFSTDAIVLVATRTFSGAGPRIAIDSVRLRGHELTAYVRTAACDGPWGGPQRITRPVHAVAVPRAYTEVRFVESHESFPGCFSGRPDTTA